MPTQNEFILSAYDLRTEYRVEPLGIDDRAPRFSWRLAAEKRGAAQLAFRITVYAVSYVAGTVDSLVWDSGWRTSDNSLDVAYAGTPLVSSSRYHWILELRDSDGAEAKVGDSWFETGILNPADYVGVWLHCNLNADRAVNPPSLTSPSAAVRRLQPAPHFRGEFSVPRSIVRARVYATAHGLYELWLNGGRVGDHELAPGWTDYNDRLMYQTFDVTDRVLVGKNALGMILGEGWWSGFFGSDRRQQGYHWGRFPEAWAQVLIEYSDGVRDVFGTDGTWRYANGSILYSDLLMGEYVDARLSLGDWSVPGYDASKWEPAVTRPGDLGSLRGMVDEPIRVMEKLPARSVTRRPGGWVVDFGQNLSGRVRIQFSEQAGTKIQLRYGETLDADGDLYTENLRTAEATDFFVCAGGGLEVFEPKFTSHGFRYMEVSGVGAAPELGSMTAVTLRNDIPWSGSFVTSDPDVNQLERNIRWGQRSNFVAVPTDCPQRDERLGWTADAQVFLTSAAYNGDVVSFFTRWLADVRYAQSPAGSFPDVAPKITILTEGAPAWGDAGVIIPWKLYRMYGDKRILAGSWDSMHRWIDFLAENNPDLIWRRRVGNNYGDWLQIDCETPREVLGTAYFAYSTGLVAESAKALGRSADSARYAALAERIKESFRSHFVDGNNRITGDTQTVYLLAIQFELLPFVARPDLVRHLVRTIEAHGNRLTTGFIGVPLLCPVLCDVGRSDLAYTLLHRDDYPSWLYSIRHGATTIWERWDGFTEDRGLQAAKMNSFNHYALGAIGEWLYRYVAGIDQGARSTGFRELVIAPRVGGKLTSVEASYDTPLGGVSSAWSRDGKEFKLAISVPPGAKARVTIPATGADGTTEGGRPLGDVPHISDVRVGVDEVSLTVPSGRYAFTSTLGSAAGRQHFP